MKSAAPKVVTYDEQSDYENSTDAEDPDEGKYLSFTVPQLPRTNTKYKHNIRTSFYFHGQRLAFFEVPKSPLDDDFVVGCNDDLLNPS